MRRLSPIPPLLLLLACDPTDPGKDADPTDTTDAITDTDAASDTDATTDSCERYTAEATRVLPAILFAADRSASMTAEKWPLLQSALPSAFDDKAFDDATLGLVAFPDSFTPAPACLCEPEVCDAFVPNGVTCGAPIDPQVPLAQTGTAKAADPGVRQDAQAWLTANAPLSGVDDGTPLYEAMVSSYDALRAQSASSRTLVVLTDGGGSCTSVSSPAREGYFDQNSCPDWEKPDFVNALINDARTDDDTPIRTFFIGLPGSDTTGAPVDGFDSAPYTMQLALSTYAASGAPDLLNPACDADAIFARAGAAPETPCHVDLSAGATAFALSDAAIRIQRQTRDCVYALPEAPDDMPAARDEVNVTVTVDGAATALPRRAQADDACDDAPCWDYTDAGQIAVLGDLCADILDAAEARVDVTVGCDTELR